MTIDELSPLLSPLSSCTTMTGFVVFYFTTATLADSRVQKLKKSWQVSETFVMLMGSEKMKDEFLVLLLLLWAPCLDYLFTGTACICNNIC